MKKGKIQVFSKENLEFNFNFFNTQKNAKEFFADDFDVRYRR
jgi:hypothetical protein